MEPLKKSTGPDREEWIPIPGTSQEIFLYCDLFELLYEGTRGPGKTDTLLMDFCQHVGQGYGPEWRGILFRQTYKQLGDVITKSKKWFRTFFGSAASFNASEHVWTFPDGEQLLLRQFQRDDDYWNYHGHEYPWVAWEELCNWSSDSGYRRMMSTCRSSNPTLPRKYRATTNPYGPGHNWVKHRFRLPGMRNRPITDAVDDKGNPEPPRMAVHGHIKENQILLAADPDYIQRIAASARNDAELAAWLDGSWDIVAGGMFDDVWRPRVHIVKPFNIPRSWRMDRAFDWGSSAPFSVGWYAESDGSDYVDGEGKVRSSVRGDLFRIAEWYGWNGRPNEGTRILAIDVAKGIVERELAWGIHGLVKPGPGDTSIFDVENGVSIAMDMAKPVRIGNEMYPGVSWDRADKRPGSRITGWEQIRKMLKAALPDPQRRTPRELPALFIFHGRNEHFERTVPVLPRDDRKMDDVDTDAEDHVGDEVRYRVRATGNRFSSGGTVGMY
jgi:hypothetical protein